MSLIQSGIYPKVSFDSQKFQSRAQKYALVVHAFMCSIALAVATPVIRAADYLRKYAPNTQGMHASYYVTPTLVSDAKFLRPLSARVMSSIYWKMAFVWGIFAFPFRYISNYVSSTSSYTLSPKEEAELTLAAWVHDLLDK